MKKLKTWQIVLLVIFYPIGICVWIYRVWKKNKLKRDAAAAAVAIVIDVRSLEHACQIRGRGVGMDRQMEVVVSGV